MSSSAAAASTQFASRSRHGRARGTAGPRAGHPRTEEGTTVRKWPAAGRWMSAAAAGASALRRVPLQLSFGLEPLQELLDTRGERRHAIACWARSRPHRVQLLIPRGYELLE